MASRKYVSLKKVENVLRVSARVVRPDLFGHVIAVLPAPSSYEPTE